MNMYKHSVMRTSSQVAISISSKKVFFLFLFYKQQVWEEDVTANFVLDFP